MKSKLYTRVGDKGTTSLVGGKKIVKSALQLEVYGTIDELNSFIGCLRAKILDEKHQLILLTIQEQLFSIGGYLSTDLSEISDFAVNCLTNIDVSAIEAEIDSLDEQLPPLNQFIVPGGNEVSAICHVCRTVCRRAERLICTFAEKQSIDAIVFKYINRLSDYFFVLARILYPEKPEQLLF